MMRQLGCTWLVVLSIGCGDDGQTTGNTVAVGAVIDQTGSIARAEWRDAAFLAIEHANEGLTKAGGYNELVFKLEFSDSTNVTSVATMRARELHEVKQVKGIVADTSGDSTAIFKTVYDDDPANDVPVPTICMACTNPNITNPAATDMDPVTQRALRNELGWAFRSSTDSDPEAVALINAARGLAANGDRNGDGVWKISIETIDDGYGNGFFAGFVRARDRLFPGLILESVKHGREIDVNAYDWAGDLAKLVDDRNEQTSMVDGFPDVIMEVTFPLYAATLTKQYVEAGAGVRAIPFLHHHNWRHNQTLVKLAAVNIEGQVGVSHSIVDNCASSGTTFWGDMLEKTAKVPGFWDSATYDAVMVLLLGTLIAIRDNGLTDPREITPQQLRDAMHKLSDKSGVQVLAGVDGFAAAVAAVKEGSAIDYVGASGPMDFNEYGNVRGNFSKFTVQSGKFVDTETYDCVADPAACPSVQGACNP